MTDEERVAQAVVNGSPCTGGCRNRPCEVDYRYAGEILAALGPQLTAEEAKRIAELLPGLPQVTLTKLSLIAKDQSSDTD